MGDMTMEHDNMQEFRGTEQRENNFNGYIEGLTLCLLALAIVGSIPPRGASTTVAETEASDLTDYVQVPYCFILRYIHRLTTAAVKAPGNKLF
jgi:hypothetical protein